MTRELVRHNRPVSSEVHPFLFKIVVGLVVWFVLAAWAFFDDSGYTGLLLAVVSGVFFMAVAIPSILLRAGRKAGGDGSIHASQMSFRDWLAGQFVSQDRRGAAESAVEIMLPIAAAAIGITALGFIFHLTAIGSL